MFTPSSRSSHSDGNFVISDSTSMESRPAEPLNPIRPKGTPKCSQNSAQIYMYTHIQANTHTHTLTHSLTAHTTHTTKKAHTQHPHTNKAHTNKRQTIKTRKNNMQPAAKRVSDLLREESFEWVERQLSLTTPPPQPPVEKVPPGGCHFDFNLPISALMSP